MSLMPSRRSLSLLCGALLCSSLMACGDDSSSVDGGPRDGAVDGVSVDGPDAGVDGSGNDDSGCPRFAQPKSAGQVTAKAIDEASGLVVSRRQPGVLWVHNDSGDKARIYALDHKGELLGTYELDGVSAKDFEDLAIAPGAQPGEYHLYVGDIGDNAKARAEIVIYRVLEPTIASGQDPKDVKTISAEALPLRYPDGAHDAETLLVDPRSGDLYVITKDLLNATSTIYRASAPLTTSAKTMVEAGELVFRKGALADVTSGLLTAGDVAPDGSAVLLRTYMDVLYWPWPEGKSLVEALVDVRPCALPSAQEPQGETVAFAADGGDYFTLSEGKDAFLYRYPRAE